MNPLQALKHAPRVVARAIESNAPAVLTGTGIAGMVAAVTFGCQATWKASKIYDDMKMGTRYVTSEEKSLYLKKVLPAYVPMGILVIGSSVCFITAHRLNVKKQTAMLTAYSALSETAQIYQAKVIEKLGESEHADIMDEIARDDIAGCFPSSYEDEENSTEIIKGSGDILCYDKVTGRYFYTTMERLKNAESIVTKMCARDMTATINDFYEALGIPDFSYVGTAIGWDVIKCMPDFFYGSMLDENKRPCMVVMYPTTVVNKSDLDTSKCCY